jgi:hypothetical protein
MPARAHRQYFSCFKSRTAIPHRGGIGHDLLIQLALKPGVVEIGYIDRLALGEVLVDVDAVTIRRADDERFAIDCIGLRRATEDDDLGWRAAEMAGYLRLPIHRSEIMSEPAFSAARAVWSYRDYAIDAGMRFRIVHALSEDGPLRFHELCQRVCGPRDPVGTLLSMACRTSAGPFHARCGRRAGTPR